MLVIVLGLLRKALIYLNYIFQIKFSPFKTYYKSCLSSISYKKRLFSAKGKLGNLSNINAIFV